MKVDAVHTPSWTISCIQEEVLFHTKPLLFALIIAIDDYERGKELKLKSTGAVIDAKAIQSYLETVYCLDAVLLYNHQATGLNISAALQSIKNIERIQRNDPILIYFAGHGVKESSLDGGPGGDWHLLLPYDVDKKEDRYVGAVYQHNLRATIEKLADEKGNNITVILDACHSHSGSNGARELAWSPNLNSFQPSAPSDQYFSSHILIAACGRDERASASLHDGGEFTTHLIETLNDHNISTITYRELSTLLRPLRPRQNPHIVGAHQGRFIFSIEELDGSWIPAYRRDHGYEISAGVVNGITLDSSFKLQSIDGRDLGPCIIATVEHNKTIVTLTSGTASMLPKRARGQQSSSLAYGDRFLVHFSNRFPKEFAALIETASEWRIKHTVREKASLLVDIDDVGPRRVAVFLLRVHSSIKSHCIDEKISITAPPDCPEKILRVLLKAAHFCWVLLRVGTSDIPPPISVEFFRVERNSTQPSNSDTACHWIRVDENENLVDNDSTIEISLGKTHCHYGMQLETTSDQNFYPYLYHFDINTLNIWEFDVSPIGPACLDFPLTSKSTLAIGYGLSAQSPLRFFSKDTGTMIQNGFFKLVVSNRPSVIPFTGISPFEKEDTRAIIQDRQLPSFWSSLLIKTVEHYGHA